MFVKKATAAEIEAAKARLREAFGKVEDVENAPAKEYMIKWLRVFAPDMPVYDAKAFCLPKLMHRNYLWHAFSFQKTDCYFEEDAVERFANGFEGPCYILMNGENFVCKVEDGRVFDPEKVAPFKNFIVFTEDFSETYVNTGNEEFGPFYKSAEMAEDCGDEEPLEEYIEEIQETEEEQEEE